MNDKVKCEKKWYKLYGKYKIIKKPRWINSWGADKFEGNIKFKTIVDYMQYIADTYGYYTRPCCRIYYLNGKVKNIYSVKVPRPKKNSIKEKKIDISLNIY